MLIAFSLNFPAIALLWSVLRMQNLRHASAIDLTALWQCFRLLWWNHIYYVVVKPIFIPAASINFLRHSSTISRITKNMSKSGLNRTVPLSLSSTYLDTQFSCPLFRCSLSRKKRNCQDTDFSSACAVEGGPAGKSKTSCNLSWNPSAKFPCYRADVSGTTWAHRQTHTAAPRDCTN